MNEIRISRAADFRRPCDDGGGCVEVAAVKLVVLRDSANPDAPVLMFTPAKWAEFIAGVKAGLFDTA
jgi:hypothetical protein